MKQAVIYTRKSVAKGLEQPFNSLDAQRDACEAYIRQQGWSLSEARYDDGGYTGANMERPALARLLQAVEAGEVEAVVVHRVDRIGRSLVDFAKIIETFQQRDVAFVSVTQNFCTTDAIGRFTLNILMSFAELEREMICERTRDKIASSRRRGLWTGGAPPFGYHIEDKKLVVTPSEAAVVQEIYTLFQEGLPIMDIVRRLNQSNAISIREGRTWARDGVRRILKNPTYTGYLAYQSELYKGEHEAVIDKTIFDRVQLQLAALRPASGPTAEDNLLIGRIHCQCGRAMTINSVRKEGKRYRYYRCIRKSKEGCEACSSPPIPAERIEAFVLTQLKKMLSSGYLSPEVTERMVQRRAQDKLRLIDQRDALAKRQIEIAANIRRIVDELLVEGEKVTPHLEAKVEALELEQAQCEADMETTQKSLSTAEALTIDEHWVAQSLSHFEGVWQNMSMVHRRGVIQLLVEQVYVDGLNNHIQVKFYDLQSTQRVA